MNANATSAPERAAQTPFEIALARRFRPPADRNQDAVLALGIDQGPLLTRFTVAGGELRFAPSATPDATFLFDSEETALGLLGGGADPIVAFMAGRFRADGNLPLVFLLLSLFRADYAAQPPG